jgi:nucleoside-diphosphate-sugar epimerase
MRHPVTRIRRTTNARSRYCANVSLHVVLGFGPAGAATARQLAEQGRSVRVVTKSGRSPEPGIEHVALDATDNRRLIDAVRGATAIHSCAAPPYHRWASEWPPLASSVCAAAEVTGAVLVILGNLYGYGPVDGPMTEQLPLAATGPKGRVRAAVWEQARKLHEQGRIKAVEVRASDFFGPGVTDGGHLAARVVPRLLRGKPVSTLGDPDTPHSWSYVPDVARALVEVAGEERAWGRPWHVPTAPALSTREMVDRLAAEAGTEPVAVHRLPTAVLGAASVFSPLIRELKEVRYQFDRPFVVDSSAYEAEFAVRATSLDEQVKATVDWWRERLATTG